MALPQGINFRLTYGYVTDGANEYAQTVTTLNYPTTTSQGNDVGWESGTIAYKSDRSSSVDARLAGNHGLDAGATATYRIDLPSTGTYNIRSAMGSATTAFRVDADLYDSGSFLRTLATDQAISTGQFVDASDTLRADAATWVSSNSAVSETFSTSIMRVTIDTSSSYRNICHLYVETGTAPSTNLPVFHNHFASQGIL